jgi:hypothetical protein
MSDIRISLSGRFRSDGELALLCYVNVERDQADERRIRGARPKHSDERSGSTCGASIGRTPRKHH